MAEEPESPWQEDDHPVLVLGRSLFTHSKAAAKATSAGPGPDLREAVGPNPLANVFVCPTPLITACRRRSVDSFLRQSLSGFDHTLMSHIVSLSADGLAARHLDVTGEVLHGIVFGNAAMPRFAEGAYFEVEIVDTRACQSDGLAIGITTVLPTSREAVPEASDALPDSWSFGYDGHAHIDDSTTMIPIAWSSKDLCVGDSVGLLVDPSGRPHVFVNRCLTSCKLPGKVPTEGPLYPFLDILGNAREVRLKVDARPPYKPPPPVHISALSERRELHMPLFDKSLNGHNVLLSEDGLAAEHANLNGEDMHGIVFLEGLLPCSRQGVYFEVRVNATRSGENDGIVIGVTRKLPQGPQDLPEVADTLPRSWSFGYDGQARGPGRQMSPISWNPKDLQAGDRVGLLIRPSGAAHLVINQVRAIDLPGTIPTTSPLYGFVDLLGNTKAVSLVQGAQPPRFLEYRVTFAD